MNDFKKIILPILGVIAFIIAVGILSQKLQGQTPTQPAPSQKEIRINNIPVKVEIAKTPEERKKGLSEREKLPEDEGMLFVFDTEGGYSKKDINPTFWMKDMKIPIDIIWIKEGKIVQIDKNIKPPAENTPDNKLKRYTSPITVDYVLEVNAGFSDKNSLKVGQTLLIP